MSDSRGMILKWIAAAVAVTLLALMAAACGGDGGGEETPAAGETPAAETTSADEAAVLEAVEAPEGVSSRVTYRVTLDVGGQVLEEEWVFVRREGDWRMEQSTGEEGEEYQTITINAGRESYICSSLGASSYCVAAQREEAEAGVGMLAQLTDPLAAVGEDVESLERTRREIAGVEASCYATGSSQADVGEGELCVSAEGNLLLLRGAVEEQSVVIEATSVSTDVTDEDFEPPYEIMELELPEAELPGE